MQCKMALGISFQRAVHLPTVKKMIFFLPTNTGYPYLQLIENSDFV